MRFRSLAAVIAISLSIAGCSSSDSAGSAVGPVSVAASGELGAEPVVQITAGEPATELGIADIAEGQGESVAAGDTVTAHYVGYGADSSKMFDSSWSRGEPATFPLDNVILGWQEGLVGMKVGGRRSLVIPAELAYGNNPPPGSGIAAGETLIFVVDLVDFQKS
jgi:peptidylprolyl isomerase